MHFEHFKNYNCNMPSYINTYMYIIIFIKLIKPFYLLLTFT